MAIIWGEEGLCSLNQKVDAMNNVQNQFSAFLKAERTISIINHIHYKVNLSSVLSEKNSSVSLPLPPQFSQYLVQNKMVFQQLIQSNDAAVESHL